MHKTTVSAVLLTLALFAPRSAAAQMLNWEDRAFVNVNIGFQRQETREFTEAVQERIYDEPASRQVPHAVVGRGSSLDIGGGVRVWRNVGVGVAYSRFDDKDDTTFSGEIPHPVFFNRSRSFSAPLNGLKHLESAVHLQFLWMIPSSAKFDVAAFAGPSFFRVEQDMAADITFSESAAPFTTVNISTPGKVTRKENGTGFNVGADITYLVTRMVGAGVFLRYTTASVDIPVLGGSSIGLDVGGFQIGFGARVRIR